ncbi:MAG: Flp pilus assembly complex ATPase component TadA [Sedimentisphaerales bacterium]|nr:Flp pilus assembly complex ATPase component TadA [Sedimentisphaerales bacterium]
MNNNNDINELIAEPDMEQVDSRCDASAGNGGDLCDLWHPEESPQTLSRVEVEEQLFQQGRITSEQMEEARSIHNRSPRKRLGQILLEMGAVQEADLLACIAEQYDLPFIRLTADMIDDKAFELLDRNFLESHNVVPLGIENNKLVVALTDPTNVFLLDEIQRKAKKSLLVKVASTEDIKKVLSGLNEDADEELFDDILQDVGTEEVEIVNTEEEDISNLEQAAGDSPVIKFVNYVMLKAVQDGASDIHIEPSEKHLKVRFRIDGILFELMSPPHHMHAAIVSRIKIMANLDIAERRLPQDGRVSVKLHKRKVDMRVSTLPTSHGEKVVIRILDVGRAQLKLKDLGMEADTLEILDHQVHRPHGIILVTGPTGSGKSTTLYAALQTMDMQRLNISTVEDPVEYEVDGITQVQVHDKIGMSFSSALRSLLRQDPDVIMVGEIRDGETARIAIQASLTGHLVLSTLHTNDAPSSITRMINIGIESYLIAASTNAVLAQRLVRRICKNCIGPYEAQAEHAGFMEMYGFSSQNMFCGKGCEQCRYTGFQGRVGLYELLTIDDTYRDIITKSPTVSELRRICKERGTVTLRDDGFRKVQAGLTTIDEVMRVTESTV